MITHRRQGARGRLLLRRIGGIVMIVTAGMGVQGAPAQELGGDQLLAPRGTALLPNAPHWAAKASSAVRLRFTPMWQDLRRIAAPSAPAAAAPTNVLVSFGQAVFNKDPLPLPQNETSIAIDPLSTTRIVGGYNDYRGIFSPFDFTGWSTSTTGGSAVAKDGQLYALTLLGTSEPSGGDPVVAVDASGNFFMASLHYDPFDLSPNGVTLFRSPKSGSATGVFSAACTGGTSVNCWPTAKVVAAETCTSSAGHFNDKPWAAVDQSSSVAAGSVYVTWTLFGCASSDFSSVIQIAKCTNNLATCTNPVTLESTAGTGSFLDFVQFSHVTVGPTGKVYVTWVKHSGNSFSTEDALIRMKVITPSALTTSVGTVGSLRTVHDETMPIPFGDFPYPAFYRTATYPHVAIKGSRAIIAWDRRTSPLWFGTWYFDSNIVAKFTDDDGVSFSALQTVSAAFGPQYQPSICVDAMTGSVVVAYYSHQNDLTFSHRQDVYVATSSTGAAPYTAVRVTSLSNDTEADPLLFDEFIGDYIEVACRGGVGYVHYTANFVAKDISPFIGGSPLFVRQQDTFVGKFTLP